MIKIHRSPKNITQMVAQTIDMVNNTGLKVGPGHVVVIDRRTPLSVKAASFSDEEILCLISVSTALPGETLKCQYAGIVNVLMEAAKEVDPGDYINTSNTPLLGHPHTTAFPGAFGVGLTSKPIGVEGFVQVLLAGGMGEIF
ncbi:MAG: hypothetical protein JKY51_04815 [Opitutaceae bacterium]|nr:hypothetical protein [Opitutaceae bacterium]